MAEGKSAGVPLDLERLRELIALMEKHDLGEVDLQNWEQPCRFRPVPPKLSCMSTPQGYMAALMTSTCGARKETHSLLPREESTKNVHSFLVCQPRGNCTAGHSCLPRNGD